MENKEAERAHNRVHIHYKREHKQSHVFLCLSLSPSLVPIHSVGLQGAKEVCAVGTQHSEAWVVTDDYFHWASHGRSCTCQGTQSRWLGPERDWMREWLEKKMDRGMRWQRRGIWGEYGELCSKVWGTVSNKRHIMSASLSANLPCPSSNKKLALITLLWLFGRY